MLWRFGLFLIVEKTGKTRKYRYKFAFRVEQFCEMYMERYCVLCGAGLKCVAS
jgi:hypothetical protein